MDAACRAARRSSPSSSTTRRPGTTCTGPSLGIPPTVTGAAEDEEPEGGTELPNSAGDDDWTGPCPPEGDGVHDYLFAVYALDAPLGLADDASPDEVRTAHRRPRDRAWRAHRPLRPRLTVQAVRGSCTTRPKKRSMQRTTVVNSSKSDGFVTYALACSS